MRLRDDLLRDNMQDPLRAAAAMVRDLERSEDPPGRVGYSRPNAVLAALDIFPEVAIDELVDDLARTRTFRVRILVEEIPENAVEGLSTAVAATSFATRIDATNAGNAAALALRRHMQVTAENRETEEAEAAPGDVIRGVVARRERRIR